jgi:hypothetical protein
MERPISADSCDARPGSGGGCPKPTPIPSEGAYSPLPLAKADLCEPAPIPKPRSGCVGEGVLVSLPSGESCEARDIKAGDTILGIDPTGAIIPQVVSSVTPSIQPCLSIVAGNSRIVCSKSHLLMASLTDAVTAEELTLGNHVVASDGTTVEVSQVVEIGNLPVITWVCEPSHTYIAAGLLHHNKVSVISAELIL